VGDPAWSPNGGQLAFVELGDSGNDIYVMNVDGSGLANLTATDSYEGYPSWSPDGTQIAYTASRAGGSNNVYIMDFDGSNQRLLTPGISPAWSPDGTRIAFIGTNPVELFVLRLADGHLTRLTDHAGGAAFPAWSPDGTRIAFTAWPAESAVIEVINADGGNPTRLTEGANPTWSPDGTRIAFDDDNQIYVISADGGARTLITSGQDPAWSPTTRGGIQRPDCTSGWSRLTAGTSARVSEESTTPSRVRSVASAAARTIALLDPGKVISVTEGPVCAHGLVFWKVADDSIPGGLGWAAEGDEREYWLEPQAP
jgi:Tol biopolymer transport system component